MPKLTVVIPVYNEAATLPTLIERVKRAPIDKEILLIDDGSTDGCAQVVADLAKADGIEAFFHTQNLSLIHI